MNIVLKTQVNGYYKDVMDKFDLDLFEALKPIGAKMEIVQFTGSKTGDVVEIKFIRPLKTQWLSKITDHGSDENQSYFIDEGVVLPKPLKLWKHKHIVRKVDNQNSEIIDDITFSSGKNWLDILLYLPLFFSFYPRKGIYRKYFAK